MARLIGWQLTTPIAGWAVFDEVDTDWLGAVQFSMENGVALPVPGLPWADVYIYELTVDYSDKVDVTVFGDSARTFIPIGSTRANIKFTDQP